VQRAGPELEDARRECLGRLATAAGAADGFGRNKRLVELTRLEDRLRAAAAAAAGRRVPAGLPAAHYGAWDVGGARRGLRGVDF
jgi:hypothetical protein